MADEQGAPDGMLETASEDQGGSHVEQRMVSVGDNQYSESDIQEALRVAKESKLDENWRKRNQRETEEVSKIRQELEEALSQIREHSRASSASEEELDEDVQRSLDDPQTRAILMAVKRELDPIREQLNSQREREEIEQTLAEADSFEKEIFNVADEMGVDRMTLYHRAIRDVHRATVMKTRETPLYSLAQKLRDEPGDGSATARKAVGDQQSDVDKQGKASVSSDGRRPDSLSGEITAEWGSPEYRRLMVQKANALARKMGIETPYADV